MTRTELNEKLNNIINNYFVTTHAEIVATVNDYIEEHGVDVGFNELIMPDTERNIDALALTRAWIEDRLNNNLLKRRGSRIRKISKALGYTAV